MLKSASTITLPPFKAEVVAVSHSALAGVMAGFALAGLFLLIERAREEKQVPQQISRAMLMLFVAFLTGGLSSYLFSTITGDTPIRGYFLFLFPSVIFAFHVYSLLGGINITFTAFGIEPHVRSVARRISYGVIALCVFIIGSDLYYASKFFRHTHAKIQSGLVWIAASWIALVALWLASKRILRWLSIKSNFSGYCYSVLGVSLAIAFEEGSHYLDEDTTIKLPLLTPILLFMSVSGLAAWTGGIVFSERNPQPRAGFASSPPPVIPSPAA